MKVLAGGVVRTMTTTGASCDAVAFDEGRIAAVGSRAEVLARVGAADVVELAGRAVVPGFIDAHHHMSMVVLFAHAVQCSHEVAPTHEAIVARLTAAAGAIPEAEWLVGYGYDARRLPAGRNPTREHLDAACPDRPALLMHYSHHEGIVNTRALRIAGIGRTTPDPPGGVIERDRRGEPTGRLVEAAVGRCERLARESLAARHADDWIHDVVAHEALLFASGITRVHDPIVAPQMEALYRRARREAGLRIPVVLSPLAPGGFLEADAERLRGAPTGEGDDALRVGPVKMVLDGGERCAMCLTLGELARSALATAGRAISTLSLGPIRAGLVAPFHRGAGRMHRGLLFYARDAARRCASDAAEHGFDPMIHAIGNEAVDVALDAIEAARRRPGRFPARIEHATFTEPAQLARAASLGIAVSTQASFLALPDLAAAPPVAGPKMVALRSMLDAGLTVALSSDHPVTPFEPLHGMRCAVSRRLFDGRVHAPDERLAPADALAGYTRSAAAATGSLDVCGTIEAGKRADLVVLSEDPCVPGALERVNVLETLLAGESVYRAG